MSAAEFTPTTEQVRYGYAVDPEDEYRNPIDAPTNHKRNLLSFDRWLAQHDREVQVATLREWVDDDAAMERARKRVEDELVEWRDARRFVIRANGLSIAERDGSPSPIVRFGFEMGLRIAVLAEIVRIESGEAS